MEYDRDREHLNLLGIFYYVNAGLTVLFSLFGLIYLVLGILALSGMLPSDSHNKASDAEMMGLVFCILGGVMVLACLAGGVLCYLAGRWLRSGKHRIFCFVVACLNLLSMPFGTILGVFTIIVLTRPRVKGIFDGLSPEELATVPACASDALAARVEN